MYDENYDNTRKSKAFARDVNKQDGSESCVYLIVWPKSFLSNFDRILFKSLDPLGILIDLLPSSLQISLYSFGCFFEV